MTDEMLEKGQELQRKMKVVRGNLTAIERTDTEKYVSFGNTAQGCAVPPVLINTMLLMLKSYYEAELEKLQKEYEEL